MRIARRVARRVVRATQLVGLALRQVQFDLHADPSRTVVAMNSSPLLTVLVILLIICAIVFIVRH
jgi:hypothetical protein